LTTALLSLLWSVDSKAVVKCGLRSKPDFSCIPLAASMGGGGHAQASGFKMSMNRLPELLSGTLTGTETNAPT
jgi:nanoRNase/pAp phosphatase (c-di-AMP/oligoRNAs hydrolase)